ncbi:MAG TPA: hypothetical protein VH392_03840, partial [Sphingomicrobium sp.]
LTLSDIYGPGLIFVARAHEQLNDWLPHDAETLDSLTGGQLTVAGTLPIVCSEGFNSAAAHELLALAGLEVGPSRIQFGAGEALDVIAEAAADPQRMLVFQHAYPGDPLEARCWIDPNLLHYLNNKAKLAELVPGEHVPPREVVDRVGYFARGRHSLPVVLKVVTDQSNGGGCGVAMCSTEEAVRRAARMFESCDEIVVEQVLEIDRNPCLNFAVMPDGEVRYLGFAEQDISPEGKYRGNWIEFGSAIPQSAVEVAIEPVRRAGAMGYRGVVGVDLAFTREDRVYVLDLNFRLNGCTAMILLAPALKERGGVMHFRRIQGSVGGDALAQAFTRYVGDGRAVPLSLFDPPTAGYASRPASVQALFLGQSREEVLAMEAEIEVAVA